MRFYVNNINLSGNDWKIKAYYDFDWFNRDAFKEKLTSENGWIPATVPGSIVQDLMNAGQIADIEFEKNTLAAEWVPQRSYAYRKEFECPAFAENQKAELVFEGIDYSSEIYLNGRYIGHQENLSVPVKYDVTGILHRGAKNVIAVIVNAAPAETGQIGRTSNTRTMKPRMTYWWDFCPRLPHIGIWRPVSLSIKGSASIEDLHITQKLDLLQDTAEVSFAAEVSGDYATAEFTIGGITTGRIRTDCGTVRMVSPRLWWCNGFGEPYEYPVIFRLFDAEGAVLDERRLSYGLRTIAFENSDAPNDGTGAYRMRINGRELFAQGCNWVPAKLLYGTVTQKLLEQRIRKAATAGVNFMRIWGGGLIESADFYRLCAKYGIMLLQELTLSSSGVDNCPPSTQEYLTLLKRDVPKIVRSRRNETALVMWDSGNEITFSDGRPVTEEHRTIKLIRALVNREDPGRHFVASSPFGKIFFNSLENIAKDPEHHYDVHGPWEHQGLTGQHQLYNAGVSMAHTEFGVEGMTNKPILDRCAMPEHLLPADRSNSLYLHRGAWWINTPLLQTSFGNTLKTLDQVRQASQYMQFDGLRYALMANRIRRRCTMILPWQFNEPYPNFFCTNIVDADGREKMAYSAMQEAYAPYMIFAKTTSTLLKNGHLEAELYVAGRDNRKGLSLKTEVFSMGGICLFENIYEVDVAGGPGSTLAGRIDIVLPGDENALFLLRATLGDADGSELACHEELYANGRSLAAVMNMKAPKIKVISEEINGIFSATITPAGDIPILFARMMAETGDAVQLGRTCICVLPGETRTLRAAVTESAVIALEGLNVTYERI